MKNISLLLALLLAALVVRLAWANKHDFAQVSENAVVTPSAIDQGSDKAFQTATFALG